MDVTIPQTNLRPFAYAIQCLSKIGKELFIEVDGTQLILRTLNDSRSAFAAFYFQNGGFFESFDYQPPGDESSVTCKILLKPVLQVVLRSLKRVLSLRIHLEEVEDGLEPHLVFDMQCDYSIVKRHQFCVEDCEIVHAVFNREGASFLHVPSTQLSQVLDHIYGTPEVCMFASADYLCFKSSRGVDASSSSRNEMSVNSSLVTEMNIAASDFETYNFVPTEAGDNDDENEVNETVGMIFGLKEVKALLSFCDGTGCQSLSLYFHGGGRPVLFSGDEGSVGLELVLATADPNPNDAGAPTQEAAMAPPASMRARQQAVEAAREHEEPTPPQVDGGEEEEEAAAGGLAGRSLGEPQTGMSSQTSARSMASSAAAERLMVMKEGRENGKARAHRRRRLLSDSEDEEQ